MRRGLRSIGISIATIAMLAACGPKQPETHDALVKLDWNVDGVPIADGHGTFTTDLGYTVDADKFEITMYSFELVPCEKPPPMPPGVPPPQRQSSLSLIGTAWAGHRVGHPPTLTATSRVETPLLTQARDFDRLLHLPDVAYCSGHYLIGKLPEVVADSTETANIGISLRLHGRYRKGDGDWTEFAVETGVAHGILVDLKPERSAKGIRLKDGDTFVIVRRLATAFNGVDFATMPPPELARQVLREVVAGTTLTHESGHGTGHGTHG